MSVVKSCFENAYVHGGRKHLKMLTIKKKVWLQKYERSERRFSVSLKDGWYDPVNKEEDNCEYDVIICIKRKGKVITAPFNSMRNLKFMVQPTVQPAFYLKC